MAVVFLAVHERIRKRAAIKVLKAPFSQDPAVAARFLNEALAVNLIQHPGIVNIFEHGLLDDGTAYLIMDYLDGPSLSQHIAYGQVPAPEALRLARQIALGLGAAHDKGIIHRDLKPANVMLVADADGQLQAKVLDFGIAKVSSGGGTQATTQAHLFMGTPAYAAPEQCFGAGKATAKSDVYALGIILYQLLTGRQPFSGGDAADVLSQQVYDSPPPLAAACPGLAPALCTLVHAMLSKEAERRPTMSQVATALQRLLETGAEGPETDLSLYIVQPDATGATIVAPGVAPVPRAPALPAPRRSLRAGALALVLLLSGLTTLGLWLSQGRGIAPAARTIASPTLAPLPATAVPEARGPLAPAVPQAKMPAPSPPPSEVKQADRPASLPAPRRERPLRPQKPPPPRLTDEDVHLL